jgi:hypothetical protein
MGNDELHVYIKRKRPARGSREAHHVYTQRSESNELNVYLPSRHPEPVPSSTEETQPDIPEQDEHDAFLRQQDTPPASERQSEAQEQKATEEPDRYQPPTGYSRLGRDSQTGDYVDVAQAARLRGLYIIGLQGYGKSGLEENLIIQDIKQNIGVCVLDPHGELVDHVIERLPDREKEKKVILLDLKRKDSYIGLNLFDCADPTDDDEITKTLDLVKHVFEKAFEITQATPLMYNLLYKISYVLIANPGCTMIDMPLFLTNEAFRKKLVHNVTDYDVRTFWETWDNPKLKSPRDQEADSQTILNKLNDFSHAPLRYIVGQSSSTIDLQTIMDEGKILLVKLDRRRETATALIGSILVALILNASDARLTKKQFNLYADEFQRFATEDFATLIEEARKAAIGMTMAHQNRSQLNAKDKELETDLKDRTRSTDNLVVFRINRKDADDLAGEFAEEPEEAKLDVRTPQRHERIEEQVEVEVEDDIKEISQNPVDFLVSARGTHGSMRVREITQNLLVKMSNNVGIKKLLVNNLLVAVMDGIIKVKTDAFIDFMQKIAIIYAEEKYIYNPDSPKLHFAENRDFIRTIVLSPVNWEDITYWANITEEMRREYLRKLVFSPVDHEDPIQQFIDDEVARIIKERPYKTLPKDANLEHMTRKEKLPYLVSGYISYGSVIWDALDIRSFVVQMTVLAEELAKVPIKVPTGQKRMVKRIQPHITYLPHESEKIQHPRRAEQDVVNEMARTLTNLPPYTARAKITIKTGPDAYTIKTLEIKTLDPKKHPDKPLHGQALQERIDSIREQNRQGGYVRPRHEVEEEIRTRQEQYHKPPEEPPISRRPQREPPHKEEVVPPPEDEPPVTRRKRN